MLLGNQVVDRLLQELAKEYMQDKGYMFCEKLEESEGVEDEFSDHLEEFYSGYYMTSGAFEILAHFCLSRSVYSSLHLKSKAKFREEISRASIYSFLTLYIGYQTCKCTQGQSSIEMKRGIIHFALNILSLDNEKVETLGRLLIDGLNGDNCTMRRGDPHAYGAWFVIDLYSRYQDIEINKKRSQYPRSTYEPYISILDYWDTEDIDLMDTSITLLSDKFLESANIPMSEDNEEEKRQNLEIPYVQLIPYEILTWLKLRELKGLKNPKTFTHPLMNTPIAKMFLNIKEPLPYPKELPYAKELLEKLKEQCPDVEIPAWLDGAKSDGITDEKVEDRKDEHNKGDNIIPDDFFVKE